MATVLDVEGNKVLGYASSSRARTIAEATALIQSEINDGDDEKIFLKGRYVGGEFEINFLRVSGGYNDIEFEN